MTDDELLQLLRDVGAREEGVGQGGAYRVMALSAPMDPTMPDLHLAAFRRFADTVAARERERCAKLCDDMAEHYLADEGAQVADHCAQSIRGYP